MSAPGMRAARYAVAPRQVTATKRVSHFAEFSRSERMFYGDRRWDDNWRPSAPKQPNRRIYRSRGAVVERLA
jgi:hypothetical protein